MSDRTCPLVLGCIADDVTGATDLAINLVQGGMRVVQWFGVPTAEELRERESTHSVEADAIVVSLKSRSVPAADAIKQSLDALEALQALGAQRFYFKYCSTFDSTPKGNVGPVAEALLERLKTRGTIYCPAFPAAGRTVYQGHLFVFDKLLNESGMENHPLNPMTDANLVRFLAQQTTRPVGHARSESLSDSTGFTSDSNSNSNSASQAASRHLAARLHELHQAGTPHVVLDACNDRDLRECAAAVADLPLVTGGSGLAKYLPEAYRHIGLLESQDHSAKLPNIEGRSAILAGSCSRATQAQVEYMQAKCPVWKINVAEAIQDPNTLVDSILRWSSEQPAVQPLLISSTQSAAQRGTPSAENKQTATAIESVFGKLAKGLVSELNVRRLVVAGGETSGAVVAALGINVLKIGPEICTGVPWTESLGGTTTSDTPLALALKSGNFGEVDFFETALGMLK